MSSTSELPPLPDALEFLRLAWALDHELHAASTRMLAHLGVTGPQRLALRILESQPRVTAGQLCRALDLHRSTVSSLVKRLESQGLVTRHEDHDDGRLEWLALTAAGRRLNARASSTIETALDELVARRGREWRTRAGDMLRDLSTAIRGVGRTAPRVRRRAPQG